MAYKQYQLDGVNGSVEFGLTGGRMKAETATKFGLRSKADNSYVDLQVNDLTCANAVVNGDLTVNGTTTTIKSVTLTVQDKNIEIGVVDGAASTDLTADGGGITLKGTTDKTIEWDNTNTNWTSSENWNLVSGKVYKINNVPVLSSTALGTAVTVSSLTQVGVIATGTWQASTVAVNYGGTGATTLTQYGVLTGNGTSPVSGITPDASTTKLLQSGGASAAPSWQWIGALYDTNGNLTLNSVTTASATDYLQVTNATGGGPVIVEATGAEANVSLLIRAKGTASVLFSSPIDVTSSSIVTTGNANIVLNPGTGTVTVPSGYENNVTANSLVNAQYVSNFVANNASTARRVALAPGSTAINIGSVLPTPATGHVYVARVTLSISVAATGAALADVYDGTNVLMAAGESDLANTATYFSALPFAANSDSAQLKVRFFLADGVTPAAPSAISGYATVEYIVA